MLTDQTTTLTNKAHLDMFQGSLLYEIPMRSQLWPFVVAGVGFTHFDSHGVLSFSNRFSYNIGGGVKYLFAPQVALRAELLRLREDNNASAPANLVTTSA